MKVLVYSDVHIRDYSPSPEMNKITHSGITEELANIQTGLAFIENLVSTQGIDMAIMAGDFFHDPNSVTQTQVKVAAHHISKMRQILNRSDLLFIPGNHDIRSTGQGLHWLNMFESSVTVINKPYVHMGVALVPFNEDTSLMARSLREADMNEKVSLIVTHATFDGSRYEGGHIAKSPLSPKFTKPVISGDLHLSMDIHQVHYCGSLIQNRFNRPDLSFIGGAIIYDTDTREILRAPNMWSRHYVVLDSPDKVKEFDPKRVIIKVRTPLSESTKGPSLVTDAMHEHVSAIDIPRMLREAHKDHPGVVSVIDEVIGTV